MAADAGCVPLRTVIMFVIGANNPINATHYKKFNIKLLRGVDRVAGMSRSPGHGATFRVCGEPWLSLSPTQRQILARSIEAQISELGGTPAPLSPAELAKPLGGETAKGAR
jgi:hypothetical protein